MGNALHLYVVCTANIYTQYSYPKHRNTLRSPTNGRATVLPLRSPLRINNRECEMTNNVLPSCDLLEAPQQAFSSLEWTGRHRCKAPWRGLAPALAGGQVLPKGRVDDLRELRKETNSLFILTQSLGSKMVLDTITELASANCESFRSLCPRSWAHSSGVHAHR